MTDEQFFATYPDRQARIRRPTMEMQRDQQHAVWAVDECEGQFNQLGAHKRNRRRILLWRVPPGNPWYDPSKPAILKIPFLAFADETIEDTDEVLLPIIHRIMEDARMS